MVLLCVLFALIQSFSAFILVIVKTTQVFVFAPFVSSPHGFYGESLLVSICGFCEVLRDCVYDRLHK